MPTHNRGSRSPFERLRTRYETSEKKCTACGFVDSEGNWTTRKDGRKIVYHHVCPSCGAEREHVFKLDS